jgi:transposase
MDDEPNELEHYGVPHTRGNPGSGRYPWGSGKEPHQQATDFKNYIARLKAEGMDEKTIASVAGVSIRELRDLNTIYNNDLKRYQAQQAVKYREKGWSHKAIGEKLGIGESLVRSRIADHDKLLEDRLGNTTEALKSELKRFNYLDGGQLSLTYTHVEFSACTNVKIIKAL